MIAVASQEEEAATLQERTMVAAMTMSTTVLYAEQNTILYIYTNIV